MKLPDAPPEYVPAMTPDALMLRAETNLAPGTLNSVITPFRSRTKPTMTAGKPGFWMFPVTVPAALMSSGLIKAGEGSMMVIAVPDEPVPAGTV